MNSRVFISYKQLGCRNSSVDLPAPTILLPWVQVPITPSALLSFIVSVQYLSCEKNKNRPGLLDFKKN